MVSEAHLQAFLGGGCPEAGCCAEEAREALAGRRLGHILSTAPGNSCFCPNTGCEVGFQCPTGSGRACLEVSGTALLLWALLRVLKTPGTPTAAPRNLRCVVELGGPFACQVLVASGGFLSAFVTKQVVLGQGCSALVSSSTSREDEWWFQGLERADTLQHVICSNHRLG